MIIRPNRYCEEGQIEFNATNLLLKKGEGKEGQGGKGKEGRKGRDKVRGQRPKEEAERGRKGNGR